MGFAFRFCHVGELAGQLQYCGGAGGIIYSTRSIVHGVMMCSENDQLIGFARENTTGCFDVSFTLIVNLDVHRNSSLSVDHLISDELADFIVDHQERNSGR